MVFFVYKCKLSLALLYLPGLFINELITNELGFWQNVFKDRNNSQLFLRNVPARAKQMPSKVFFVGKKT